MSKLKTKQMKAEAKRTGQQTHEEINQAVEDTKEKSKEIVGEAKQEAKKMAEQQQQNIAHHIDGLTKALTKTADNLDLDEDPAWVVDGTRQTAQALDKVSKSLRERDFNTILRDIKDYTREQPTLVLGGAAIAGFFLSRFLKSSENRGSDDDQHAFPMSSTNDSLGTHNDEIAHSPNTTGRS